jgi:hypothetical protein
MKKIQKVLRLFALAFLVLLAMTGVGIFGALFGSDKKYENERINVEMKEKEEEDDGESGGRIIS